MTSVHSHSNSSKLTNRYIIALKDKMEGPDSLSFLREDGIRHLETFDFPEETFPGTSGDMLLVELPDTAQATLSRLTQDPRIDFLEQDMEFELQDFVDSETPTQPPEIDDQAILTRRKPNDLNRRQWGLDNRSGTDIDAPEAWVKTIGRRSNGPIIAVIDTGVDTNHADLQANLWVNPGEIPNNGRDDDGNGVIDDVHGFDAFYQDGEPEDAHGHGTHCAGIIGATGHNRRGITGVNWQTRIMPVKIFDNSSSKPKTSTSAILRGIAYAVNNGARITSNSWGGPSRSQSVQRAFANSQAFHVMGAGNDSQDNDDKPFYPASYRTSNSVSVAAVTSGGNLSSFSNFGDSSVDLAAPGSAIYSTLPGGRYGDRSGTSMATPHVAGVAGLMLSIAPSLSNNQIRSFLLDGVVAKRDLQSKTVTGGMVNANNSLELLLGVAEKR
jgi:subtilisin family serine protease